jgi:excisionase family DNA binding protein
VSADTATRRHWVKAPGVAEHLDVTVRTVFQMVKDGRITAYRNGARTVRFDLNEVDAAFKPYGGSVDADGGGA